MKRKRVTVGVLFGLVTGIFLLFSASVNVFGAETGRTLDLLRAQEAEQVALVERLTPSLVAIYPVDGSSGGSGVVISEDGFVVTNFHVVQPCGVWMKVGMAGGRVYDAVVVGLDPVGDVALIKILPKIVAGPGTGTETERFTPAVWGDSDLVCAGDRAWVLGNPFGFEEDFTPSVSHGIVSGTHRYQYPAGTFLEYADCIQVDAPVNPGNSGGPLFNAAGELIGINGRCSFEKRGRINVGVGYAISSNQVKYFLSHLRSGRVLDHATLGATVASDVLGRPVVNAILEDSDVALRGLDLGDRILSFAGRQVATVNDFKNVLGIFPKGWCVPIEFSRKVGQKTETQSIWVRLSGVHSRIELEKFMTQAFPDDEGKKPGELKPGSVPEMPGKPGEGPKPEGKPGDGEKPGVPSGIPAELLKMAELYKFLKEMPVEVQKVYEKRDGYVNYYFNRQETVRVWKAFTAENESVIGSANVSSAAREEEELESGKVKTETDTEHHADETSVHPVMENVTVPETLQGKNGAGVDFELIFSEDKTVLKQASVDVFWENKGDFTRQATPPESRMLVPGLTLWREVCQKGPEVLELRYFGESPLPFHDETGNVYDVLEGNVGGVEARFYFTKSVENGTAESGTARLVMMELDLLDGGLPWEFRFSGGTNRVPESVTVYAGGVIFETLNFRGRDIPVPETRQNSDNTEQERPVPQERPVSATFSDTALRVQPKMVKIYGVGGFAEMEEYQTGVFISADGMILTAFSPVLNTDELECVLYDGSRYTA
ncbi:MAG: trypsin-like peptidase domain-containing protein, partial [Planctomycetia bacterium]|nr:trypsin-like peptidase domain-containing protein [Planctomycetia bacterium]